MRNIANKTDNVSTLSAAEFNASIMQELENTVTKTGITLDGPTGPDTDDEMLAQAVTRTAQGAVSYQDSGAADAYVLTATGGFKQPAAYTNGMTVLFQAGNTSTGASTINVAGIGVTDLKDKDGTAIGAGGIVADTFYLAVYNTGATEFRITIGGDIIAATQAQVEAETANKVIDAAVLKYGNGVAKAWVNFNGTGTIAIRSSYNVSSIVDIGTGAATVNIDNNMSSANYCVVASSSGNNALPTGTNTGRDICVYGFAAGSFNVSTPDAAGSPVDFEIICATVFGDLA